MKTVGVLTDDAKTRLTVIDKDSKHPTKENVASDHIP